MSPLWTLLQPLPLVQKCQKCPRIHLSQMHEKLKLYFAGTVVKGQPPIYLHWFCTPIQQLHSFQQVRPSRRGVQETVWKQSQKTFDRDVSHFLGITLRMATHPFTLVRNHSSTLYSKMLVQTDQNVQQLHLLIGQEDTQSTNLPQYNNNTACVAWSHTLSTKGLQHFQIGENAVSKQVQSGNIDDLQLATQSINQSINAKRHFHRQVIRKPGHGIMKVRFNTYIKSKGHLQSK